MSRRKVDYIVRILNEKHFNLVKAKLRSIGYPVGFSYLTTHRHSPVKGVFIRSGDNSVSYYDGNDFDTYIKKYDSPLYRLRDL